MNKFAKIESPSDEEKKHISEEAQYIDQPVADDIKIKKNINKRRVKNMYRNEYEGMVHEAYEDILGSMEKEAAARWKEETRAGNLTSESVRRLRDNGYKLPLSETKVKNSNAIATIGEEGVKNNFAQKASEWVKKHPYQAGVYGTAALAIPTATALIAKKKKKDAEEVAEKAAAYFDEAQLIKEAAANDYEVACAYEEAALNILGELGYFTEE